MKIINLLFGFLTLFNNVISVPLSVNSTYMNKYNDYILKYNKTFSYDNL